MSAERYQHTATRLGNGKVLVAGGRDNNGNWKNSSNLYDPATSLWSATGNLNIARYAHTATLLIDGRVLVAGGFASNGASAELYDPSTGSWNVVPSMSTSRVAHVATLLANGTVLVAGGFDGGGNRLASAEVFDPTANNNAGGWTPVASMVTARSGATATLLSDGTVLIAGGLNVISGNVTPLATAERYSVTNRTSGTWTPAGNLSTARYQHAAALLVGGTVLIAGGYNPYPGYGGALSSAEMYDPTSGTWTSLPTMSTGRYDLTATQLPNGFLLIAGGSTGNGVSLRSTELYNASTRFWSAGADMSTARCQHSATSLVDGKVLAAGGRLTSAGTATASAEVYTAG